MKKYTKIANSSEYRPRRRHDLESLVRTIMYFYLGLELPPVMQAADTIIYWEAVDEYIARTSSFWKEAIQIVRNKNDKLALNTLKEKFKIFNFNFVDNNEILEIMEKIKNRPTVKRRAEEMNLSGEEAMNLE
jgi:hypothetical protein